MATGQNMRQPIVTPTVPASQIPYLCWCGFRGTLDQQEDHRAEHRKDGKPK